MATISAEEFLKGQPAQPVQPQNVPQTSTKGKFAENYARFAGGAKDLSTGAVKGFLEGAMAIPRMAQSAGQGLLAALDPTKSYQDIKQQTGIPEFQANPDIDQQLMAKNKMEKAGKVAEFLLEVFYPVGKTKTAARIGNELLDVGSDVAEHAGAIVDDLKGRVKDIPDLDIKGRLTDLVDVLDDKTKTALTRTPRDVFDKIKQQGVRAMQDDRIRTPLENVGDEAIDALRQIKDRATSIAQQKNTYVSQAKIGLQRVGNISRQAFSATRRQFANMKLDAGDKNFVNTFMEELKNLGDNPTFQEVDKTVDFLQDMLYKSGRDSAVVITDRVTGPMRRILGEMNGKLKTVGGPAYQRFNSKYSEMMDLLIELNARMGKEGGQAGSFVKRLFSPSDARTKYLFEQMQKLTGKDFVRDARIAKFVMDALGDSRAASLLEDLTSMKSKSGIIDTAVKWGLKKVTDPMKQAEQFIEKLR